MTGPAVDPVVDPHREKVKRNVAKMEAGGASASEIETYIQSEGIPPVADAKPSRGAFLAPIAQGATLGFADEALGAVEGLNRKLHGGSFTEGYTEGRDKVRAATKQFAEDNPKTSTALTIAGGLAPAVAVGGGLAAKAGAGLVKRAALSAVEGAGFGGVAGFGSGEGDAAEQAKSAATGALTGAAVGGALPVAGAAIRGVRNAVGRTGMSASRQADALIARALERDATPAADLPARAAAMVGKPAVLPDLAGENVMGLARGAQATPSQAKESLASMLHRRQAGQLGRVAGDVENSLGMQRQDIHDVAEQLIAKRKAAAGPLYEKAYAAGAVSDPSVIETLNLPPFKAAYDRGVRIAKLEGVDLPALPTMAKGKPTGAVPVQAIDYVKRALDDVVQGGMSSGSIGKTEARALRNRLAGMLETVDQQVPEYGAARAQFAGDAALSDALDAGKEFITTDHRVTAKQLAAMTDGEREMYKVGALDAVRQAMDKAGDGADVVKRIFGSPLKREQFRVLVGDDQAFANLEHQMQLESRMTRTKDRVTGGSPTARIQTELHELGQGNLVEQATDLASNGWKDVTMRAIVKAMQRTQGNHGEVADAIAQRMGLAPGTPEFDDFVKRILLRTTPSARGRAGPVLATGTRRALSAASGREQGP